MHLTRRAHLLTSMAVALGLGAGSASAAEHADLLLYNGKVLTVDRDFSIRKAIAVRGGRIVEIGDDDLSSKYEARTKIDLGGRTLMPGFIDTHLHIYSLARRQVVIESARSIKEIQQIVRAKAAELGPGEWITGYGWDEAVFVEGRNLNRADLDAAAPDNPVALTRAGGHSAAGNSLALKIAKIDRNTADPPTGLIEHDEHGEPNGVIRERFDLYLRHVPPSSWEELKPGYVTAMRKLLALGITSFHSATTVIDDEPVGAGGTAEPTSALTPRRLALLHAETDHAIPRVTTYIGFPGAERLRAFGRQSGDGDEWVRLGGIGENPVDGGFTGPTAWTLADYKGMPGFRGKGRFTDAQLQALVDASADNGWQLALHAIGDAAIVQAVDAYASALDRHPAVKDSDHRWFLDHFTIMPPDATMAKMAKYRIMISQQPNFAYNLDGRYHETMDDIRYRHNNSVATPWKRFGLHVAFGSDNLPIGPMVGLHSAVTRQNPAGVVVGPEERVSMEDAIRAYTEKAAYLSWEEGAKGTLEPGKLADMIVLDADPLTAAPDAIMDIRVDMTILGGKVVYRRGEP